MEENKYKRGSEWRKWDLHVHTKSSYDYKYDGDNPDDKLIETLRANKISVVAITDHFVIDKDTISGLKSKAPDIIFFPGVELRTDKGGANIHPIIIFDEKSNLDELCEDFNAFKRSESKNYDDNDKIYWDYEKIIEFSKKHNGVISIHAGSKKNGIDEQISNYLPVKTAIKEEYANSVCIYEIGKIEDIEEYKNYVFPKIGKRPLIIGSDNHKPTKYPNEHNSSIFTWIKADPTFEGLKQIINEPDRVYIGENEPQLLERVETYPTKFIKNISIKKKEGSAIAEEWYGDNTSIDINPGLVAIVGNKGSGKSAITDIISLCANTHNTDFSFLRKEKFRNSKPYNRANNFEAQIAWYDDSKSNVISLNENGNENQPERVKYIPQNFLENLCTTENDKDFEEEIKSIIFQYLPEEKKFGKSSLDEIVSYLSSEIKNSEKEIIENIISQNEIIIELENKKRDDYKEQLESSLKLKKEELDNLQKAKPAEVLKPNHESDAGEKSKQEEIDKLRAQLKEIEEKIVEEQNELSKVNKQIQDLSSAKDKLKRIEDIVKNTKDELKIIFESSELNIDDVIQFKLDESKIDDKISSLTTIQKEKESLLDEQGTNSLRKKKSDIDEQIQKVEKELGEPDRLYHKYVEELRSWQEKVDAINGKDTVKGSVAYYEAQLKYINEQLDVDLEKAKSERKKSVITLIAKKREEIEKRSSLYEPVSAFINRTSDLDNYSMKLDASFIFDGIENFFDFINQRNAGSFCGKEQGTLRLKEIQEVVNLSDNESIYSFAESLNNALMKDEKNNKTYDIKSQIRDSHTQSELYNFIYGLDYIKPLFQLKLDDKPLSALSPGERGALLLLFYLFIDMDDKPLIIDQPEENLDNESVYKYLVKFIKQAKEKRQIIMVTHNPNLAVVCDADQVIKMDIDKKNKNTVSFMSGSIENPDMNRCIVDVLEGTYPAFHNRDNKYFDKAIR
ncbi:MAG: AAA family ATPase [bacterium]|nr:AAA family ATPase [Candidatus Limimorpha caballi]